jgi:hypothetical protein
MPLIALVTAINYIMQSCEFRGKQLCWCVIDQYTYRRVQRWCDSPYDLITSQSSQTERRKKRCSPRGIRCGTKGQQGNGGNTGNSRIFQIISLLLFIGDNYLLFIAKVRLLPSLVAVEEASME